MGAWRAIRHRLEEAAGAIGVPARYVGRPWRASPSEGYPTAHLRRAGPDRPRSPERLAARGAEPRLPVGKRSRCEAGCLPLSHLHELPALRLRQPAPDLVGEYGEADRAWSARNGHGVILAQRATTRTGGLSRRRS